MMDIIFDMETGDPDDFLTLLFLLGRRDVNLKAVTITPGTPDQVGLVHKALGWFSKKIPVGAFNIDHPKSCVSGFHYRVFGDIVKSFDADSGASVLIENCDENTTLVTGAPLKNLGEAIRRDMDSGGNLLKIGRWVAQGGFAGAGVVPEEKQLEKFKGKETCPTYNFNGDMDSALLSLDFKGIYEKRFVSKNVCHGVYYNMDFHKEVAKLKDQSLSHSLIHKAMEFYLKKNPAGKKFHDPLAACCAIDQTIGTWKEVELYKEKGEWGALLSDGSGKWIIIDYDHEKFVRTFVSL